MIRKVLAAVAGIVTAFIIVGLIESLGHIIYAPPAELDYTNSEELNAYIDSLPVGALLFPLLAWVVASFVGGLVACYISKEKPFLYASLVGGIILLATIANLLMIQHPAWFAVVSVLALILTMYITGSVGYRLPGVGKKLT
ncbi:MAG: hypothetical protein HUJ29_03190 [Gammaproteobacteria bacterium]|nr:hypothetical protein [Gammaproteobacteria bacterium]